MLPKKGHALTTWLPTVSEMVTRTTRLVGSNGWETHTNTVLMPKSTLSSMKPGFSRGHSPVTGGNDAEEAQRGHAEWNGNTLRFTGEGRQNYWFVPAVGNCSPGYRLTACE